MKDPNRICGYDWSETPELGPMDPGWQCPHVCFLTVADHGDYHECCSAPNGRTEL